MEILTKENIRLAEFTRYLYEALGDPDNCNCKNDFTHTERILKNMGGIDIEGTIEYFEQNSAFCDCEIIFNILLPKL